MQAAPHIWSQHVDEYTNFTGEFIDLVRETNIPEAKTMCDRVLNATSQRTVQAAIRSLDRNMIQGRIDRIRALLSNIFSILLDADMDARTNTDQVRLDTLRANFQRVRNGFDGFFPKVFRDRPNQAQAAWTSRNFNDATVNFSPVYLDLTPVDQAVTLVHKRAHTFCGSTVIPARATAPSASCPTKARKGWASMMPFAMRIVTNGWRFHCIPSTTRCRTGMRAPP